MAALISSAFDLGGGTYGGKLGIVIPPASAPTIQGLPPGITSMNRRPVGLTYHQRFYLIGQFSRPLVRTEYRKWHAMGIHSPLAAPVLASGGGSGGSIGSMRGVVTFGQREGKRLVHESAGSDISNALAVNGEGRTWSTLATSSVDERVNVSRGYLSIDGDPFRYVWERPLGVTTVIENVKHLARGEQLNNRRGVPPYTRLAALYHGRMTFGMDPKFPSRWWYSEDGEPESVYVLNWRDLPNGAKMTGLSVVGMNNDTLVLFSRNATYDLQGYGGADFNLRTVDPVYGNVAPFGPANVHGFVIFPSQRGLCIYAGGAVHFLGDDLQDFWIQDYEANTGAYENGWGFDDKEKQVYKFTIPLPVVSPPVAPAVALYAAPGPMVAGSRTYRLTAFRSHAGKVRETEGGAISGAVVVTNPSVAGQTAVTFPTPPVGTLLWGVYRAPSAGGAHKLVAIVPVTDGNYLDNIADAALGAEVPTDPLPRTLVWVLHYLELDPARVSQGVRPPITFDVRVRPDSSSGRIADPNTQIEKSYTGSCDGLVREENVDSDGTDDGDIYRKRFVDESGHDYLEDVGGNRMHGKLFVELTVFVVNPNQAATFELFTGPDEAAAAPAAPTFPKTIPSGASVGNVERDEFYMLPYKAGTGFTTRLTVDAPTGVKYRGVAGTWRDGLKTQPASRITSNIVPALPAASDVRVALARPRNAALLRTRVRSIRVRSRFTLRS